MKEEWFKQIKEKTQINKEDILSLASSLQSIDCENEEEIRNFLKQIAYLTNKEIDEEMTQKLISIIRNKKIPTNISNIL